MNIEIVSKMCVLIKFIYWALSELWKAEGETSIKIICICIWLCVCECMYARIHIQNIQQLCKQTYAHRQKKQKQNNNDGVMNQRCLFCTILPFSLGWQNKFIKWLCVKFDTNSFTIRTTTIWSFCNKKKIQMPILIWLQK